MEQAPIIIPMTVESDLDEVEASVSEESLNQQIELEEILRVDGGSNGTFWAYYGTTTYSAIAEAIESKKLTVAVRTGIQYQYLGIVGGKHTFTALSSDFSVYVVQCDSSNHWTYNFGRLALNLEIINKANRDTIAIQFTSGIHFSVGDYTYYNEKLYRFVADHDRSPWNASDVVEIKLADEVKNMGSGQQDGS